jgi:hypothetical protein
VIQSLSVKLGGMPVVSANVVEGEDISNSSQRGVPPKPKRGRPESVMPSQNLHRSRPQS